MKLKKKASKTKPKTGAKKKANAAPRWGFHGEVVFEERELPAKSTKLKTNVLQGSTTPGHEHIVRKGNFELRRAKGSVYLVAKSKVVVGMKQATERHRDIKIPDGTVWLVTRAIEADHITNTLRAVSD